MRPYTSSVPKAIPPRASRTSAKLPGSPRVAFSITSKARKGWPWTPPTIGLKAPRLFSLPGRYRYDADPLDRLLAYVDFRKALLSGELPDFTCLAGTMVQEVYDTHPALREACSRIITGHAAILVPDIEAAMRQRDMHPE